MACGFASCVSLSNLLVFFEAVSASPCEALSVAMFSGVQLLSIGVMGEYLGRLYENSLRKPQYTIESVVRAEQG